MSRTEMKKYRLGEIADFNKSTISKADAFNEIVYLDTGSITENEISGKKTIDASEAPSRAQRKVGHNTIVYSTVRPRLKHYGLLKNPQSNFIVSTGFVTIDIKDAYKGKVDPRFLYLLLTQPCITEYIGNMADTAVSAYPSVNPSAIASLNFNFPALPIQRGIADLWENLDRKIALNRRMIGELEAMARELYEYWFVQFDFPDGEGKPYRSGGGRMEWNARLKREIPAGWEDGTLGDFLTIKNGRDHKHLASGFYPVFGSGGEMRKVNQHLYSGESVLMPRKGSLNNVMYVDCAFWTVDTMFYSVMKGAHYAKYVFYSIKDIDFSRWNSGTGVPSMTSSTLYSIKLIRPENEVLARFDEILKPYFLQIEANNRQIRALIEMRDGLLPLLMNGQATVG